MCPSPTPWKWKRVRGKKSPCPGMPLCQSIANLLSTRGQFDKNLILIPVFLGFSYFVLQKENIFTDMFRLFLLFHTIVIYECNKNISNPEYLCLYFWKSFCLFAFEKNVERCFCETWIHDILNICHFREFIALDWESHLLLFSDASLIMCSYYVHNLKNKVCDWQLCVMDQWNFIDC